MRLHHSTRALIGAAFLAGFLLAAEGYPVAAPNDYRFELVQAQPAGPGKTTVTVRLVHVPESKPVAGAVLFETKTDMGPGGMAEMTGKVTPLPADQFGLYRFQVETGMAGKWQLALGARCKARPARCAAPSPMRRSDHAAPTLPITPGAALRVVASSAGDHAFGGAGVRRRAGFPCSARRHAR
jgi:YtkA-like